MALPLVLVITTLVLFALFWGGSLVAQGYLYQNPASHLPARAAGAALLVALFLTFWVWVDKRAPGKYDTFFEFAGETSKEINEFEAVRWTLDPAAPKGKVEFKKDAAGKPVEKTAKYKRAGGGRTAQFHEVGTNHPFTPSTTDSMTAALLVKPDEGAQPVRFQAELKKDDRTGALNYTTERRFVEEGGSRYIKAEQPGVMYVPSSGVVVVALLLNLALFVVWFAALWPVLRFSLWHAVGFAVVFGLVTMLLVMPLLFKPNRTGKVAPEAAAVGRSVAPAVEPA